MSMMLTAPRAACGIRAGILEAMHRDSVGILGICERKMRKGFIWVATRRWAMLSRAVEELSAEKNVNFAFDRP